MSFHEVIAASVETSASSVRNTRQKRKVAHPAIVTSSELTKKHKKTKEVKKQKKENKNMQKKKTSKVDRKSVQKKTKNMTKKIAVIVKQSMR